MDVTHSLPSVTDARRSRITTAPLGTLSSLDLDLFLRFREAAALVGISTVTAHKRWATGRWPTIRLGPRGHHRVPVAGLIRAEGGAVEIAQGYEAKLGELPALLNVTALSSLLKICRVHLQALLRAGALPSTPSGRDRLIRTADVLTAIRFGAH